MDKRLHQVDTLAARGSDGRTYRVHGYEHLVRGPQLADGQERWEPSGEYEYKLDDGRPLRVERNGALRLEGSDLMLDV